MTANTITSIMGWPSPQPGERLIIRFRGRPLAVLHGATSATAEGVYLIEAGHGRPNACYSAPPAAPAAIVRRGLALKLFGNGRPTPPRARQEAMERLLADVTAEPISGRSLSRAAVSGSEAYRAALGED